MKRFLYLINNISDEISNDLFARIRYNNFLTSKETTEDVFEDSRISEIYFGIYYGM